MPNVITLFIAYETRTGRVVEVHSAPERAGYVWAPDIKPCDESISVIRGSFPSDCAPGKHYRVDVQSKQLVETMDESGVCFGVGRISA